MGLIVPDTMKPGFEPAMTRRTSASLMPSQELSFVGGSGDEGRFATGAASTETPASLASEVAARPASGGLRSTGKAFAASRMLSPVLGATGGFGVCSATNAGGLGLSAQAAPRHPPSKLVIEAPSTRHRVTGRTITRLFPVPRLASESLTRSASAGPSVVGRCERASKIIPRQPPLGDASYRRLDP
jgi:hypothetical protein